MLSIDTGDPTPLYAQLERAIRAEIAAGGLRVGDRLPTVRRLATDLRINPNTVAKVYSELERGGVLATQRGVGTFVRAPTEAQGLKTTPQDREYSLRQLSDRLLADAHVLGITIDEIMQYLASRRALEST